MISSSDLPSGFSDLANPLRRGHVRRSNRSGFFLVIVLIVIAIATMAVYSFTELMVAFEDSSNLSGDIVQARVNVESAAATIRVMLAQPPNLRADVGGIYNNPQMFQAVTVTGAEDFVDMSNFSVLAPALSETGRYGGLRFGLQNESARLNVNTLTVLEKYSSLLNTASMLAGDGSDELDAENISVTLLMTLPGMTEDIADCILDWIDEDDEVRTYGAESEYYISLPTPYSAANGPIQSVEELLLVRGVTPTMLFGADTNRSGVLDADEQQRFGVSSESAGVFGWAGFLTVHGAEANKSRDGNIRVNVNQDDMEVLYEQLNEAMGGNDLYATYIVAYRIAGQSSSAAASGGPGGGQGGQQEGGDTASDGGAGGGQGGDVSIWTPDALDGLDLSGGAGTSLTQILDLIDSTVTIGSGDDAVTFMSPFQGDPISMAIYMPILMDVLTTQDADTMPGRINLNECPAELLYGIPTLPEETIETILEERTVESDDLNRNFETWPLVEGIVTLEEMRLLLPLVTCGGDVYRAQIVGYFEQTGASHRAEVIIDATTVNPQIVSWRDFSHLGRGFELSVLGLRGGAADLAQ